MKGKTINLPINEKTALRKANLGVTWPHLIESGLTYLEKRIGGQEIEMEKLKEENKNMQRNIGKMQEKIAEYYEKLEKNDLL